MYQPSAAPLHRIRSFESVSRSLGPATQALERSLKRRRVSNEKDDVGSVSSMDSLFSSLSEINSEEAFPAIVWVFDDEED